MGMAGNRSQWLRVGGSLLVGMVFGPALDLMCQLIVFKGDIDGAYPPVFGLIAASAVIFVFWDRLARVRLQGLLKSLAIGTLIGMAAGAVFAALVYPPVRMAMGPQSSVFTEDEASEIYRGEGAFIGVVIGGLIGGFAGWAANLLRKPKQSPLTAPQPAPEDS